MSISKPLEVIISYLAEEKNSSDLKGKQSLSTFLRINSTPLFSWIKEWSTWLAEPNIQSTGLILKGILPWFPSIASLSAEVRFVC